MVRINYLKKVFYVTAKFVDFSKSAHISNNTSILRVDTKRGNILLSILLGVAKGKNFIYIPENWKIAGPI